VVTRVLCGCWVVLVFAKVSLGGYQGAFVVARVFLGGY